MKRMTALLAAGLLALSIAQPGYAEKNTNFNDESIYDLLVDRFNNGLGSNDFESDAREPNNFNGGDFAGISARLQHLLDMQFTMISIGPVFKTASYDGRKVLNYKEIEPHFGTAEELVQLIDEMHSKKLKVMADFPLGGVSEDHVLASELPSAANGDGTINWDLTDSSTQQKITEAAVQFVKEYDLDGIRLTAIDQADRAFLNDVIAALKKQREGLYVITNTESAADFDSMPAADLSDAIKQVYVEVDADSSALDQFSNGDEGKLLQFDDLTGPRFTHEMVEKRQFPPTRWKTATVAQFMLPGVPLVPYATEIAVNGKEAPESHPFFNFKTDMELHDWIGDLNNLRNSSSTLRTGDFEMLHNQDGFTVFSRTSDDEQWIIAINNTSETQGFEIDAAKLGDKKKLRGVIGQDLIKKTKDDKYHIVVERELAEAYIIEEDTGYNTAYLVASIAVVVLFSLFLTAAVRKGRRQN